MDFLLVDFPEHELEELIMNEQISADQINAAGHLMIGGCDAVDLAAQYGTPLVVYDVSQIRQQIRAFQRK